MKAKAWTVPDTDTEGEPLEIEDGADGEKKVPYYWPSRWRREVADKVNWDKVNKTVSSVPLGCPGGLLTGPLQEAIKRYKISEAELITLKCVVVVSLVSRGKSAVRS